MRHLRRMLVMCVIALFATSSCAQQEPEAAQVGQPAAADKNKPKDEKPKEVPEPEPTVTHHQVSVNGKVLHYAATAGRLPIKNADGEIEAYIFFIAYVLDNPPAGRPLMFSFNGGPGSSSVWLHLGAIGPKRVRMLPEGGMPQPPFQLIDNEYTWLDQTDLVFIDPVGTGYSRPAKKDLGKKFWGVKEDIQSVGEFIRFYLTRYQRWSAPLFLVGESYGTTRASGLSGYLIEHGVAFNGIVLVSSVLNFQTLEFANGNDLPFVLYLPSYAAAAWYHKKLPPELQQQPLDLVLRQAERWATATYAPALEKGDRLSAEERQQVIQQLARFTGLSSSYLENANLRVEQEHFCKELLRDQKKIIGRLDSRFTGTDLSGVSETPAFDPSMAAIRPPFTAAFNDYVRRELGYKSHLEYYILGGGFSYRDWNWGSAAEGFPDVTEALRSAMAKNSYMKVFVASGYFDLATPYFATNYTLSHLTLLPPLDKNVSTGSFEAGHMMYIKAEEIAKLKRDVSQFIQAAVE